MQYHIEARWISGKVKNLTVNGETSWHYAQAAVIAEFVLNVSEAMASYRLVPAALPA